ncbi:MAG TPA: hypothetical protein VF086_11505 [Propionibacteriaceae bacterium]
MRFDRPREEFPDGRYGAGADIGPDEWTTLRIDIDDTRLTVAVNGTVVLTLIETRRAPAAGNISLFVEIGSEVLLLQPQGDAELSCTGSAAQSSRVGRTVFQ